ncbi:unnamed protein product [Chondrus crispus]|uniref:Cyclic nucleotide-binding domain-containing protein n=1 Tax=Chondrus crispus TaxID=2769 RepID=R7QJC9_CHOCR|nr:unnamed protein product [Chondrus crispus]CDF37561.1 unnamed protein product [Chondrus crispus]|eukprot:XP_005717432.1 unnamed protein product [Chondrus crispus]
MFSRVSASELRALAGHMHKLTFSRGDVIIAQSEGADRLLLLADGYARRLRRGRDGVERYVETQACGATLSALHVTAGDPIYATAKCVTQTCAAYAMSTHTFRQQLRERPHLATQVIEGLSEDLRIKGSSFRTPLLAQRANDVNFAAVCVAATVESYYRSALNSVLNHRLSGLSSPLFPNMHVQVPARVAYIAGFKGLRALFDREIDPDKWDTHPTRVAVRVTNMVAPGIVMTPISSLLEACNVGHANPEPLMYRATRGLLPRGGREVIFGIGLNQLSDFFEERYRNVANAVVAGTAGSLSAGVVAGYFSHVPHNLSTYKLMNPNKPYPELFRMFVDKSVPEKIIPNALPKSMLPYVKATLACLIPRGVGVRTVQICGSFALLNGIIQMIEKDNRRRAGGGQPVSRGEEQPEPEAAPA